MIYPPLCHPCGGNIESWPVAEMNDLLLRQGADAGWRVVGRARQARRWSSIRSAVASNLKNPVARCRVNLLGGAASQTRAEVLSRGGRSLPHGAPVQKRLRVRRRIDPYERGLCLSPSKKAEEAGRAVSALSAEGFPCFRRFIAVPVAVVEGHRGVVARGSSASSPNGWFDDVRRCSADPDGARLRGARRVPRRARSAWGRRAPRAATASPSLRSSCARLLRRSRTNGRRREPS